MAEARARAQSARYAARQDRLEHERDAVFVRLLQNAFQLWDARAPRACARKLASRARPWEAFCLKAAQERGVLRDADHPDAQALAVRDAWELALGGPERRAALEISMAQRQVVHWPQGALAQADSHARRAAADSSLVWKRISSQKSGAPSWHVVPRPQAKLPAEQPQAAARLAWSLRVRTAEPVLELQEQLQEAGRLVWEQQQRAQRRVLPERVALQRGQQASQQSPQALEQVSALQVWPEQARQPEEAQTQQEREERQQREEVAEALPRRASDALPLWLHPSRPFRPRLFARPRLPLQQRHGSACALSRLRRRRSNSNAFFSR